jgi:long-chain acyl-CoA synthetase
MAGPIVAQGYYKMPEQTREAFQADGFHTGDIGLVHPDGNISIIDRKKDLVKLQHGWCRVCAQSTAAQKKYFLLAGEYLSLGKVEALLKTLKLVDNVCVLANPLASYCAALVVPSAAVLAQMLQRPASVSAAELCADPAAKEVAVDLLHCRRHEGKKGKFMVLWDAAGVASHYRSVCRRKVPAF